MFRRFLAVSALTGLLAAQPGPLDPAWDLLAKGDRDGALRVVQKAIANRPRDGEARLLLGSILSDAGRVSEAIIELKEAVRLLPRSPLALNALGEAYNSAGDLKSARTFFEKAILFDAKFAQGHVNLGSVLAQLGENGRAAEHLDRALALLGSTADASYAQYLRAKIYTEQKEPDKAASMLKKAVWIQPGFAEAWSDLGQAQKALLDDDAAFGSFQRSVELNPDNAISQYRLGAEYLRKGKAHDAVTHLQASYRIDSENQSTLYSLQMALRQDGQIEEARRVKEKLAEVLRAIDTESQNAFLALRLNNEGAALEKSGNLSAAVAKYRSAVAADRAHSGYQLNLAVALLRLGQWQEGLAELREEVRRNPGDVPAETALRDALEQAPVEFGGQGKGSARRP